jgi:cyclic pyranopterin phosphate synthase
MLQDRLGRTIDNLRVSVTDRCNFRCTYCMPEEGLEWLSREEILTFEEICRFVRIATGLGVRKVRLTGGEPLLRKDLDALVRMLVGLPGLKDISLTTNGLLLAGQAERLSAAGLRRVNVSLDSLDEATFVRLARRSGVDRVLEGLEAAGRYFEGPIKVNAVILRGINDHELVRFAEFARDRAFEVRFIEFMPLDAENRWTRSAMISGDEILRRINEAHPLVPDPDCPPQSPSRDYVFADGIGGRIGFINSVTEPFCESCNRIRITADGHLRTCLFSVGETDIKSLLRGGASDQEIGDTIRGAVWNKEPGHRINAPDFVRASRSMSQIGG